MNIIEHFGIGSNHFSDALGAFGDAAVRRMLLEHRGSVCSFGIGCMLSEREGLLF